MGLLRDDSQESSLKGVPICGVLLGDVFLCEGFSVSESNLQL